MTGPVVHLLSGRRRDGDLGEQARREGLTPLLQARLRVRPVADRLRLAQARAGAPRLGHRTGLLVAGGAVVGDPAWAGSLRRAVSAPAAMPLHLLGAGVDRRIEGSQADAADDRRRWSEVLRQAATVTSGGPASAARLAALGIDAPIVGDPGLLRAAPMPARLEQDTVAVVLGRPPVGDGHVEAAVARRLARAVAELVQDGVAVRLLVTDEADRREVAACAAHVSLSVGPVPVLEAAEPTAFFAALDGCSLLVGQRHAALVLSAAAGVPVLAVGDAPGIDDLLPAIDRAGYRVDDRDPALGDLAGRVRVALASARFAARRQAQAVEVLRQSLRAAVEQIEASLRPDP